VQVVWKKFMRYFNVEPRIVPLRPGNYRLRLRISTSTSTKIPRALLRSPARPSPEKMTTSREFTIGSTSMRRRPVSPFLCISTERRANSSILSSTPLLPVSLHVLWVSRLYGNRPVFLRNGDWARTRMTTQHPVDILVPLTLGSVAFVCTTVIHALPIIATVNFIRCEKSRGRAGASFWIDVGIVARTISYATAAHLVEVGLWALLFVIVEEFQTFWGAYYHSATNCTTLGYGDIVMSAHGNC